MAKIDYYEERRSGVRELFKRDIRRARKIIPGTQLAIYIMAGGGLIGRLYSEQPADAYRDDRAGRAPYKFRELEAMRGSLVGLAEACGMDPHHLPEMPPFHSAGVF
jgi:hypothetical protein